MISYDLRCDQSHVFEAWFGDRQAFLDQRKEGLVECPMCGSREIDIAFTGCSIKTGNRADPQKPADSFFQGLRQYLHGNFEDVGEQFAEEALRIHYEESEKRSIRGVTTPEEEEDLKSQGVDFIKIPLPKLDS
jgi:hypothetical protein